MLSNLVCQLWDIHNVLGILLSRRDSSSRHEVEKSIIDSPVHSPWFEWKNNKGFHLFINAVSLRIYFDDFNIAQMIWVFIPKNFLLSILLLLGFQHQKVNSDNEKFCYCVLCLKRGLLIQSSNYLCLNSWRGRPLA